MNGTQQQLIEIFEVKNSQRFRINTYARGICIKCKRDCKRDHYTLNTEYDELRRVINNITDYNQTIECLNHSHHTEHLPYRCPNDEYDKCGRKGYARHVYSNLLYF